MIFAVLLSEFRCFDGEWREFRYTSFDGSFRVKVLGEAALIENCGRDCGQYRFGLIVRSVVAACAQNVQQNEIDRSLIDCGARRCIVVD